MTWKFWRSERCTCCGKRGNIDDHPKCQIIMRAAPIWREAEMDHRARL